MEAPKESLEKKNIFAEKYDEIRRLGGKSLLFATVSKSTLEDGGGGGCIN
jgi:hypothetical protein